MISLHFTGGTGPDSLAVILTEHEVGELLAHGNIDAVSAPGTPDLSIFLASDTQAALAMVAAAKKRIPNVVEIYADDPYPGGSN